MSDPEKITDLLAMQAEFEFADTKDERRIELIQEAQAILAEEYPDAVESHSCPTCHKIVFYAPFNHSLTEGHVYSQNGLAVRQITGFCEFCFDHLFNFLEDGKR